jgi:polysaccharide export outer membrane protein
MLASSTVLSAQATALRAGDKIELAVYRDSSLSGTFPVDERGRVTLPLLGARQVSETPWPALRDSLLAAYQRELSDPAIRLTPLRRVFVLGFVERPGTYYADPTVAIAGVISLAGGAAPEGDLRRIRLVRNNQTVFAKVAMDDARMLEDVQSGDQLYVDRRGWFDRNAPFFVSAMVGVASIVVTLLVSK